MRLLGEPGPAAAELQTGLTRAVLHEAAAGRSPETLRLYRPRRVVAFGRRDAASPGFRRAATAARAAGYQTTVRAAGGRAAVFHPQTIAFAWARPDPDPGRGVTDRYRLVSGVVRDALASLGVDARVGKVAGEYCPGAWSVNAGGRRKLMGVGQRLIPGAAHTGGVIVVDDAGEIRRVLQAVYAKLDIKWNPDATGAVAMYVPVSWEQVREAVLEQWRRARRQAGLSEPKAGRWSEREWDAARRLVDLARAGRETGSRKRAAKTG